VNKKMADKLTDREAQTRMKAALRGARIVGHKPKESMTPKRPKPQPKQEGKKPGQ
jgi:hypothetical protein